MDFEAIEEEMGKLAPPRLSLEDVLGRLREKMIAQRKKGVSVEQMREVLKGRGIEVGVRSLKTYLEKGELLGRRKGLVRGQEKPVGQGEVRERVDADGAGTV